MPVLLFALWFSVGAAGHEDDMLDRMRAVPGLPGARLFTPGMLESKSWLAPLEQPDWRPAAQASHMRPDDVVLAVARNGRAWALPWWIMKNHHIANLELDGRPMLVSFCEVCSSGAAFDPRVDGRRLRFRLAGLYQGTNLAVDEATGSFWAPSTGKAVDGPLKGTQLEREPLFQSEWQEWLALHPGSLVAFGAAGERLGHGATMRPGTATLGRKMKGTLARPLDPRLPANTLVLGMEAGGLSLAFPIKGSGGGVVMLDLGGEPLVVLSVPDSLMAIAFSRRLDDGVLSFERQGPAEFLDLETGSTWNLSGTAVRGPLAGRQLSFVPSGIEEWYVWAALHPDTGIYGSGPGSGPDAAASKAAHQP